LSNTFINCTTPGDIKPLKKRKTQKKKEQDVSNMKTIRILNINFKSIKNKQDEWIVVSGEIDGVVFHYLHLAPNYLAISLEFWYR
jgi:hypothetical protein